MRIENERPIVVFAREYDGKKYYSLGLSKKDKDGKYLNGYIDARFRKDVEIDDKKKIYIKDAWIDFYVKDKKTIHYIFVNEFQYVGDVIDNVKKDFDLTQDDLPF